jgi:hypothetical protein
MSRIDSLTQIRVRLTHATTQVSPTSLERIRQAWAGVPMYVSICMRTFVCRSSGRGPNNSFDTSSELLGPIPALFYVSIYMRTFVCRSSGRGPNNSFDASSELLGPLPEFFYATLRGHNRKHPSFHPLLVFSCLCACFLPSILLYLFFFPFHHG